MSPIEITGLVNPTRGVNLAGSFALPAYKLRRMVALSPTFAAAVAEIQPPAAPLDKVLLRDCVATDARPYAVLSSGQSHNYKLIAGGGQNVLRPDGSLGLYLAKDTPDEFKADPVTAEFDASSFFGLVIDEIAARAGADDPEAADGTSHLPITSISLQHFDESPEEYWNSFGRFWFAVYLVEWGDGD